MKQQQQEAADDSQAKGRNESESADGAESLAESEEWVEAAHAWTHAAERSGNSSIEASVYLTAHAMPAWAEFGREGLRECLSAAWAELVPRDWMAESKEDARRREGAVASWRIALVRSSHAAPGLWELAWPVAFGLAAQLGLWDLACRLLSCRSERTGAQLEAWSLRNEAGAIEGRGDTSEEGALCRVACEEARIKGPKEWADGAAALFASHQWVNAKPGDLDWAPALWAHAWAVAQEDAAAQKENPGRPATQLAGLAGRESEALAALEALAEDWTPGSGEALGWFQGVLEKAAKAAGKAAATNANTELGSPPAADRPSRRL